MKKKFLLTTLLALFLIGAGCQKPSAVPGEGARVEERLAFKGWGLAPSFTYPAGWQISSPNNNNDRSRLVLYVTNGPFITLSNTGASSPDVVITSFAKDFERSHVDSVREALKKEPEVYDNILVEEFLCAANAHCSLITADIIASGPAYDGDVVYTIVAESSDKVVVIDYLSLLSDDLPAMEELSVRDFDFSPVFDR